MEQAWYTSALTLSLRGHKLTWIGTCISTLETHCYGDYYPQQEVVDYFDKAVEIFAELPSYKVCVINLIKLSASYESY